MIKISITKSHWKRDVKTGAEFGSVFYVHTMETKIRSPFLLGMTLRRYLIYRGAIEIKIIFCVFTRFPKTLMPHSPYRVLNLLEIK